MLYEGHFNMIFPEFTWWSVIFLLITTHITILTVTIYLHRSVAHRSLTVSKPVEHFFRFWCWFTTGQSAREWAAVHRKHHAFCEQPQDPHSPKVYGFWTVLFKGVMLYRNEAKNPETLEKYGKMTPDDWIEHKLYRKTSILGLVLLALIDLFLFGFHGIWIYLIQIAWIPFWAAGVINGLGHFKGYRNFNTTDDSTNIFPWGIIIGGEELHNNHHAYPTSAKLSMKWYEFDIGWMWIKILSALKLAKVNKIYELPVYDKNNNQVNDNSVNVFLGHKYFVWKMFTKHTRSDVRANLKTLRNSDDSLRLYSLKNLKKIFYNFSGNLSKAEHELLEKILKNDCLKKLHDYKESLWKLWNDRHISFQQIKENLHHLAENASSSKEKSLEKFMQRFMWLKPVTA